MLHSQTFSGEDVTPSTRQYQYDYPKFDPVRRESLGFLTVQSRLGDAQGIAKAENVVFCQVLGIAGRVCSMDVLDDQLRVVRGASFGWGTVDGGSVPGSMPGVWVPRLSQTLSGNLYGTTPGEYVFKGGTPGPLQTTTFGYENPGGGEAGYNFVTEVTQSRTLPTPSSTTMTVTPDHDPAAWLIGRTAQMESSSDGVVLSSSSMEYLPGTTLPSRVVVKEGARGTDPSTWIDRVSRLEYDTFGNLRRTVQEGDPTAQPPLPDRVSEICYDGDTAFPDGTPCSTIGDSHTAWRSPTSIPSEA